MALNVVSNAGPLNIENIQGGILMLNIKEQTIKERLNRNWCDA